MRINNNVSYYDVLIEWTDNGEINNKVFKDVEFNNCIGEVEVTLKRNYPEHMYLFSKPKGYDVEYLQKRYQDYTKLLITLKKNNT